jgi:hypothetical protein
MDSLHSSHSPRVIKMIEIISFTTHFYMFIALFLTLCATTLARPARPGYGPRNENEPVYLERRRYYDDAFFDYPYGREMYGGYGGFGPGVFQQEAEPGSLMRRDGRRRGSGGRGRENESGGPIQRRPE